MHDPSTVCFDIKYPWKRWGSKSEFWPKGYRDTFITIWHEDPLNFEGKICRRDDDSCGWSGPLMTEAEYEQAKKWSKYEYGTIFAKQVATAKGESYAYVCHDATCHEAIYWLWRYIKYETTKAKGWKFLGKKNALTSAEIEQIFNLASNPVDSLKFTYDHVVDEKSFWKLFLCVYLAYKRHNRPWYRHPRWHIHHWQLQIHPWQKLRRRLLDRCVDCGKGFGWNECPTSDWSGKKLWHSACSNRASMVPQVAEETTGTF